MQESLEGGEVRQEDAEMWNADEGDGERWAGCANDEAPGDEAPTNGGWSDEMQES